MIIATYGVAGSVCSRVLSFAHGVLTAKTLSICFTAIFFLVSSAASAAYLTVSGIFPLGTRAFTIAIFHVIGTLVGGVGAMALFGVLISLGSRKHVEFDDAIGAVLMLGAAVSESLPGVSVRASRWNASRCLRRVSDRSNGCGLPVLVGSDVRRFT